MISREEASELLEDVLDTLVEWDNISSKHATELLHEAADKLFKFRDEYFKEEQPNADIEAPENIHLTEGLNQDKPDIIAGPIVGGYPKDDEEYKRIQRYKKAFDDYNKNHPDDPIV